MVRYVDHSTRRTFYSYFTYRLLAVPLRRCEFESAPLLFHLARAEQQRAYWQSLCEEAKKQEEAESRFYERQNASREKGAQSAMSQAERDYAARIDRIYDAGTLYFRAKVDGRK